MIAALLLAFSLPQSAPLVLSRGASLPGGGLRYWAVEDTTLDGREPEKSLGGNYTLTGGDNRTILIRFGDLNRACGPNVKIRKATLHLNQSSDGRPRLLSIGRVLAPWGEGPMLSRSVASVPGKEPGPVWAATWRQRRSGPNAIAWQEAGAQGPQDVAPIQGASMTANGNDVAIEGLAATVQQMLDRWYDNHGLALRFDGSVEFDSSQAPKGKPYLELELESTPPSTGPDLSVTLIDRTPEYDRYTGDNVSAKHGPADGEEVTYTAHVKNVGDAPAQGFSASWSVHEKQGSTFEVPKTLAPGEETTIKLTQSYKNVAGDHRTQPILLRIEPKGPDAVPGNNALQIFENALSIGVTVSKGAFDAFVKDPNVLGSHSFEDQVQAQVRAMNEFVLPQSRFSFALDGALERVRIQRITIADSAHSDAKNDIELGPGDFTELGVIRQIARQMGEIDLSAMTFSPTAGQTVLGKPMTRASLDLYPGLTGGGDTRFEGNLPGAIWLGYEPYYSPLVDPMRLEGTDLLSATDVAAINAHVGKRRGFPSDELYDMPVTVLLKLLDANGKPIEGAELAFFQIDGGKIPDSPTFTVVATGSGTVLLPNRPSGGAVNPVTGKSLRANPFGDLKPDGSNGLFLVRAIVNGEAEWTWLKAWQLVDAVHRGSKSTAFVELRLNASAGPLDHETNLAKGRLVSDSSNSLPAKLAALVDDDPSTSADLSAEWVEIDLGRDRAIGEVRLIADAAGLPAQFEIYAYPTGGQPNETNLWTREVSWGSSLRVRSDLEAGGQRSVAYRGPGTRARFIRILGKSGALGKIAEIRVVPLKAS